MSNSKFELTVFQQTSTLREAAARFIVEQANLAVEKRGRFVIALSGGETPLKVYDSLASDLLVDYMPWAKTFIFWGDERYVPVGDKRNNAFQAHQHLLDKINIPGTNIYRIPVSPTPDAAAKQYQETIFSFFEKSEPHFDLILLGLGDNGHTASLFPHSSVIREKEIGVRAVFVEDQEEFRITMTAPMINLAHQILFLVTGSAKAAVLPKILRGDFNPDQFPAQLIHPKHGKANWFVDAEAASALTA